MSAPLTRSTYAQLLRTARRHSRNADEAEDLLQEALLAALAAGREPAANRGWIAGTVRNRAKMAARGALRRRFRETAWQQMRDPGDAGPPGLPDLPADLPRSLSMVMLLALTGHSRAEIKHLLRISDEALRQRIAGLRKRLGQSGEMPAEPLLVGALAFGSIRRGLLPAARRLGHFVSHDPDGHPLAIGFILPGAHETPRRGN